MIKGIKARFSKGVIKPLEKLNIKEGERLEIIILSVSKGKGMIEALDSTAGGWRNLIDAEELKRNIYSDRLVSNRPEPKL